MPQITQVQLFQVEIEGKLKSFESEQEARAALARVDLVAEVGDNLAEMGLDRESKMFVGKQNVILDYLSHVASKEGSEATPEV